jgi:5'-3' exonuclease
MGIPYYFYTIYNKYHEKEKLKLMISENEIGNLGIEHLFFDYNSMIHPCAHEVIDSEDSEDLSRLEENIIEKCIQYTRYVIAVLKPTNVYIMIDGVAPRAKMNQQRERRYKSKFLVSELSKAKWDSNKITPGTYFMKKLRRHLDIFVKETDANIKISDSSEPGEGEHKMMKYISENLVEEGKTIAIYGLDADLIMLSLRNIRSQNIVLLRDNTFNSKLKESERTFTYLEISQLKKAIHMELGSNKIEDYIMICFLLGNDFLEHLPSLQIKENGMSVLLKHYKKAVGEDKSLVNGSDINLEVLYEILMNIGNSEDYFYKNVYSVYQNNKRHFKDANLLEEVEKNGKVFFYKEDYIKFNEPGYKKRYYSYYGVAQSDVKTLCRDYLEGLYWILLYYDNHRHDNWSWYYEHHAIPFASDLAAYLKEHMSEFLEYIARTSSLRKSSPCTEIEQLCMVLPRESLLNVIEPTLKCKIERVFRTDSCDLENMYPKKISVDILYKEYMWQSKIFIEPFKKSNLEIIRDLILQEYII